MGDSMCARTHVDERHRDLEQDQVAREPQRHAEDDQEPADERRALQGNVRHVRSGPSVRWMTTSTSSAYTTDSAAASTSDAVPVTIVRQHDRRQPELPLRVPDGGHGLPRMERCPRRAARAAAHGGPARHRDDQQQAGNQTARRTAGRRAGSRRSRRETPAGSERTTDRSSPRPSPGRATSAAGYRAATSTGSSRPPIDTIVTPDAPVSGVKNASTRGRDDRQPARHPADERGEQPRQPPARAAGGEDVAAERKQRHRRQHRRRRQPVCFPGTALSGRGVGPEEDQRGTADRREDRHAERGGGDDDQAAPAAGCSRSPTEAPAPGRTARPMPSAAAVRPRQSLAGAPDDLNQDQREPDRQHRQHHPRRACRGRPYPPAARSIRTKSALAITSAAVTATATPLVNTRTRGCQRAGSRRGVDSASS